MYCTDDTYVRYKLIRKGLVEVLPTQLFLMHKTRDYQHKYAILYSLYYTLKKFVAKLYQIAKAIKISNIIL